jgi:hypothetical protein
LNVKEFATIPAPLINRQKDINALVVFLKDIYIYNFKCIILLNCNNYQQKISFEREFDLDSNVKVNCTCPSFNFEFANVLYKNDCLLEPNKYLKAITKLPQEKNRKSTLSGCKHVIAATQFIIENQNKINQFIKRKINKEKFL